MDQMKPHYSAMREVSYGMLVEGGTPM